MKKLFLTVNVILLTVPAVALANKPTLQHTKAYQRDYLAVAKKYGTRAPGRNIVRWGMASGKSASDAQVVASIGVLERMITPPPVVVFTPAPIQNSATSVSYSSNYSSSSLESCIIRNESGGNPGAVSPNGKYKGIGQWDSNAWVEDGGTKYASSPTGATYSEQQQVLAGEGSTGMETQQGQFDGCG